MTRVKICGLTRAQDVDAAVEAGADATGFIVGFPKSPRNLTLDEAEDLVKRVPPFVGSVLVTNPKTLRDHLDRIREIRPDAIQLHGELSNPGSMQKRLRTSLIKVVPVKPGVSPRLNADIHSYDAVLTDTYVPGYHGGTGTVSDWLACAEVRRSIHPLPMILSGGLNHANVARAIAVVRPFAVDASSGVESAPGKKDARKIIEFIRRAKGDVAS